MPSGRYADWSPEVRARHNARTNAARMQRVRRIQEIVREAKDVPCADCGQSYPYYVMDFDHVRGTKAFNLATAVRKASGNFKKLFDEIAKCDVVCANCHRERTHQRNAS
jgi:hypothetical protein